MRTPLLLFRISIYGLATSAVWLFAVAAWRFTGVIRFR